MIRRLLFLSLLFVVTMAIGQTSSETAQRQLCEQGNASYDGNDIRFLGSAAEKYETMFRDISEARRFIHLEYFRVRCDSVGSQLLQLLVQKAREGVEVRLLIDGYGNSRNAYPLTPSLLDSLQREGIQTGIFDSFRFPWVNHIHHRDHRKIVVVDGKRVYTGGMNVGDYYLTGTARSGPWRDMHVCLEGAVVDGYESVFARMWEKVTGEHLDSLRYSSGGALSGGKRMVLVNREPGKTSKRMRKAYRESIDAAQREIRIVNPYPTNVRMVRRALKRALRRGVRVRVMASANSDIPIVPDVVAIELRKLARKGCEVYYYEGGFHHSKLMTVDGEFCTVGTANLDGRSMRHDYEVNVFVFDKATTQQLDSLFDRDLKQSTLFVPQDFRKRFSLGHRMSGRVFNPLKGLF